MWRGEGRQDEYGQSFVLGRNFVAFVIVAYFTCVFIYINTPHTHTQTHMLVIVSECTHVRMFYLFSFYSTRIRAGKARQKKKENIIAKYLLYFFYSKPKQSKNKKKVKKRN